MIDKINNTNFDANKFKKYYNDKLNANYHYKLPDDKKNTNSFPKKYILIPASLLLIYAGVAYYPRKSNDTSLNNKNLNITNNISTDNLLPSDNIPSEPITYSISSANDVKKLIDNHPIFSLIDKSLLITEGDRNKIYDDSLNKPTIGIGHLLSHEKKSKKELAEILKNHLEDAQKRTGFNISTIPNGNQISDDQIYMLFYSDLLRKEEDCSKLFRNNLTGFLPSKIHWNDLSRAKKAAIIHLAFQVGANGIAYKKIRDKKTNKVIGMEKTKLLTHLRNGDFKNALLEFDHSAKNSFNNKCKRYIEMYLFSNGNIPKEAIDKLLKNIQNKNKRTIIEKQIKNRLREPIADINKKLGIKQN